MPRSENSPRKLLFSLVLPAATLGVALLMGAGKKRGDSDKVTSAAVEAVSKAIEEASKG